MKRLLIILIGFFCVNYSNAQIEFQGIMYTDYSPGVKIEFELINTSASEIETIHIQLRRILPDITPSFGNIFYFDPPLQPGELRWIDPFDYCVDAQVNFATEFEAKIYNIDGQVVQISQVLGQVFTEVDGCSTLSDTGALQIFCEECGNTSGIYENLTEAPQDILVDVYTTMGELMLSKGTIKNLANLPQNQLFIVQYFTENGYQLHKIIIN
jgi:hypothetical protein